MSNATPPIYATQKDYEILTTLSGKIRRTDGPGAHLLLEELERLQVVEPESQAPFVRLGARVRYHNPKNDKVKTARLVLPKEQSLHESTVTVTSPMGAALLGLQAGDEFSWREPGGSQRRIAVLEVLD